MRLVSAVVLALAIPSLWAADLKDRQTVGTIRALARDIDWSVQQTDASLAQLRRAQALM